MRRITKLILGSAVVAGLAFVNPVFAMGQKAEEVKSETSATQEVVDPPTQEMHQMQEEVKDQLKQEEKTGHDMMKGMEQMHKGMKETVKGK